MGKTTKLPPDVDELLVSMRKCISDGRYGDAVRRLERLFDEAVASYSGVALEHELDAEWPGEVDDELVTGAAKHREKALHAAHAGSIELANEMRRIEATPSLADALRHLLDMTYREALATFRSMYVRNLWNTTRPLTIGSMAKRAQMDRGWLAELLADEGLRRIRPKGGGRG